ncbi:MAG: Type 3 secretion system secretin [Chlamydiia bacterium]|nr:Type 3 secretion system secretin [Chlamydiia bacterium]MCH9616628.1 Type 3 secretion system secretin [Chlamydiia bacterium]MCH9629359.1 Type 3 secretion system secretin [Chlamydiia bacterium]
MAKHLMFLLLLIGAIPLCADKPASPKFEQVLRELDQEPGYTVNFKDVSAIEVVKFLSKIGKLNFLYNEAELGFNVTIVSERQTSLADIMTAFLQVLSINNLQLTEDGSNLIIHGNDGMGHLADVISPERPFNSEHIPPLVTRVFFIEKGNPDSIAHVLKPMLSKDALIEVSSETRHLIVTDLVANVVKIADLLETLDAPSNSLAVGKYQAKDASVEMLIPVLKQVLTPLGDGNPLIIVPQAETNTAYIVTTPYLLSQAIDIFKLLDIPPTAKHIKLTGKNVFVYQINHQSPEDLINSLKQVATTLTKESKRPTDLSELITSMRYNKTSHSLIFIGSEKAITEIKILLSELDTATAKKYEDLSTSKFYIYQIKNADSDELRDSVEQLTTRLKAAKTPDEGLIATLNSMKWIQDTNSMVFTGPASSIDKLKQLMPELDKKNETTADFYIYKLKSVTPQVLTDEVNSLIDRLKKSYNPDRNLIKTLETLKYVPDSNSVIFTGDKNAIARVKELLPELDDKSNLLKSDFYVYTPKNLNVSEFMTALTEMGKNLKKAGLADEGFLKSIESAKWSSESHAVTFIGNKTTIDRLKALIPTLDVTEAKRQEIYIYRIQNTNRRTLTEGLSQLENSLTKTDPVKVSIENMQYLPESNSFVFKGSVSTIARIKDYLMILDGKDMAHGRQTFELYKVENVPGNLILKELKQVADNMQRSGLEADPVVASIDTLRYIKSTNSIYVTGTPDTIKEVIELIKQFDIVRPKGDISDNSNFFMYKPTYAPPAELKESLLTVAEDLKAAGLTDQSLINTILTVRTVESSQSLLFTGEPDSIAKVKELLKTLDNPDAAKPIQKIGQTTFFIYKLQYITGPQLSKHLKALSSDLKKSPNPDKHLIEALNNMRYVPETNSVVFTGTEDTLKKVQAIVKKFDVIDLADVRSTPAETYLVYKPKHQSGEELIQILHDFEQNLSTSGVEDQELIEVINNLKWMPKTQSILISGTKEATTKVKELLERFDVVGEKGDHPTTSIETIDDTSFLVYKLQYHQGLDIQTALQGLAADLTSQSEAKGKESAIARSINSIQWIQITNSLIGSGNAQTLEKLRELIKGLDVPLRQVMIEVLVIETTSTDSLDIELLWQSQGNYKKRLAWKTGTFPTQPSQEVDNQFQDTAVGGLTASTRPSAQNIPLPSGGTLGVIGDIILHHGKSYIGLGDFINAVKATEDTVSVWNQKIITQDNQTSTIFIGQNLPYTGSVVTTQQNAGNITANSVEYRDVGTKLIITPTLGSGDIITLEIDEEITEATNIGDDQDISTAQLTGIRTAKKTTQTRVTMPDRHFLALSGQVNDTTDRLKTGIPCLGSLPILGAAFAKNNRSFNTGNTIIFIYPQIIHTFEEYQDITDAQEDLFREQAPYKEDFDRAIELVKTPDDM